ncbi:MAG: S9 family peptidase [Zetaproteobacteria bacterium]|nr:S9 family peptidase [Zetaproteobacteria bacterium]
MPQAPQRPHSLEQFGETRQDPWFWLKEKSNPQVRTYVDQENHYTAEFFQPLENTHQEIFAELRQRMIEDDESVGYFMGAYRYFKINRKGLEYPIFMREERHTRERDEIFDINQLAQGHDFFGVGFIEPSPDHRKIALGVDLSGEESYSLWIYDVTLQSWERDILSGLSDDIEWSHDSQTLFYVHLDEQLRPKSVHTHTLGHIGTQTPSLFYEEDSRFFVSLGKTEDEQYILICSHGNNMSEWRFLPLEKWHDHPPTLILPRSPNHEYDVTSHGERWIIKTNLDRENFEIIATPMADPRNQALWQRLTEVPPHALVEDYLVLKDYLVFEYSIDATPMIRSMCWQTEETYDIHFDSTVRALDISFPGDYDQPICRFTYETLISTAEVYDYQLESNSRELLKKEDIPGIDSAHYRSERLYAKSHDGARVPVSLAYHRDTPIDGTAPVLQVGYGAYGISSECRFRTHYISLLDRGFVVAICHTRGGMDLGYRWYTSGKLLQKKNTFYDFHAISNCLIEKKYTQAGRIIGWGGSAGGILMGYIANEYPTTYGGIIAHVPFVDVLTTMLDSSLPLTTMEYNEWGNPNDAEYYHYMHSYSPYDNVKAQQYPEMLVVAGWNDTRVTYWEPTKWVAKLRSLAHNPEQILLRIHDDSGHFGASGRYAHLHELTTDLVYMCYLQHKWNSVG